MLGTTMSTTTSKMSQSHHQSSHVSHHTYSSLHQSPPVTTHHTSPVHHSLGTTYQPSPFIVWRPLHITEGSCSAYVAPPHITEGSCSAYVPPPPPRHGGYRQWIHTHLFLLSHPPLHVTATPDGKIVTFSPYWYTITCRV